MNQFLFCRIFGKAEINILEGSTQIVAIVDQVLQFKSLRLSEISHAFVGINASAIQRSAFIYLFCMN